MSNPNWPSFPGLQNLTQDGDGRPQVLDLIPGRQRGTPLNSLLFNPLIRSVCDLQDAVQGIGDFATKSAIQNYLPLAGGRLSGDLSIFTASSFGSTLFGGKLISGVSGQTANSYLQTQIINGIPVTVIGQQNGSGWHNLTFNPADGSLSNPEGQKFALQSAVDQERQRAQEAEAGLQPAGDYATKDALQQEIKRAQEAEAKLQPAGDYAKSEALQGYLPLAGGRLSGDLSILTASSFGSTLFGGKLISGLSDRTANSYLQTQIINGTPVIIIGHQNDEGWHNWTLNPNDLSVTNPAGNSIPEVSGMRGRVVEQVFVVTGQSVIGNGEAWVSFPTPFAAGQTPILSLTINRESGTFVSRSVSLGNQNGTNQPNVTNTGFSFQPWYAKGDDVHTSGQPWTLHVRAIGVV